MLALCYVLKSNSFKQKTLNKMENLTNYSDLFILGLMEDCNLNPHKATANVQLSFDGKWYLTLYQTLMAENGLDEVHLQVFSEEVNTITFCDVMKTSVWNANQMAEFWKEWYDPNDFHMGFDRLHPLQEEDFEASDYDSQLEYYQETLWISQHC